MSDKPHIPLSELRKLWKSAIGDWMNYAPRAKDLFRSRAHDEVQRRRIKGLEAEIARLRGELDDALSKINILEGEKAMLRASSPRAFQEMMTRIGTLERANAKLRGELAERDDLRAQLASKQSEIDRLNTLNLQQLERDKAMLQARNIELGAELEAWEDVGTGEIECDCGCDSTLYIHDGVMSIEYGDGTLASIEYGDNWRIQRRKESEANDG